MADQRKGNKVQLSTWGKQSVIGYKTKDENSKTYVDIITYYLFGVSAVHETRMRSYRISRAVFAPQLLHLSKAQTPSQNIK